MLKLSKFYAFTGQKLAQLGGKIAQACWPCWPLFASLHDTCMYSIIGCKGCQGGPKIDVFQGEIAKNRCNLSQKVTQMGPEVMSCCWVFLSSPGVNNSLSTIFLGHPVQNCHNSSTLSKIVHYCQNKLTTSKLINIVKNCKYCHNGPKLSNCSKFWNV